MTETTHPLPMFQELTGAFNRGDRDRFLSCLASTVTARTVAGTEISGADETVAWFWAYREAFPDVHVEIIESIVAHDRGAFVLRSSGTQSNPLRLGTTEMPATGRHITWDACYIVHLGNGGIERIAVYADGLGFTEALGHRG